MKTQVESLGPDAAGLTAGAMVHFWLQLMPGASMEDVASIRYMA